MLIYYRIKLRDQCEAIGSPILSHTYLTLSCFLPSDLLHLVHLVQEDAVSSTVFLPGFSGPVLPRYCMDSQSLGW